MVIMLDNRNNIVIAYCKLKFFHESSKKRANTNLFYCPCQEI